MLVLDVTEAEADKLLATLDPIAALAEQDDAALRSLFETVQTDSDAVKQMLAGLLKADPVPETFNVGEAMAAAPELVSRVKPGEVWRLGRHRLMCGDATTGLAQLMVGAKARLVWTDPPYNVDYGGRDNSKNPKWKQRPTFVNDNLVPEEWDAFQEAWLRATLSVLDGAIYVCMSAKEWPSTRRAFERGGGHWSSDIVWVKDRFVLGRKDYHSRYEAMLYGWPEGKERTWLGGRTQDDVWEVTRHAVNEDHPTQKPLDLVRRALALSCPIGGIVLDPFLGSGTTLVAAEQAERVCYGMEIEPRYCEVAIARWESYTGESAVCLEPVAARS